MHGVVSLLDPYHYAQVAELWHELEADCGLVGIRITPIPHVSWAVAQDYDLERLQPQMREIALIGQPFTLRTSGIGLFTGPRPVLFITVVKDPHLLQFHEMVWSRTKDTAITPSLFYTPQTWVPHITLAHGDTDWEHLSCALDKLVFRPFTWEIVIDNIALISQTEGVIGVESIHYKFGLP